LEIPCNKFLFRFGTRPRNCILRATLDLNRIAGVADVWTKNRSGNTLIVSRITGTEIRIVGFWTEV